MRKIIPENLWQIGALPRGRGEGRTILDRIGRGRPEGEGPRRLGFRLSRSFSALVPSPQRLSLWRSGLLPLVFEFFCVTVC